MKLIGATTHYVISDLDEGPIIEQAVERVDHTYRPEHLVAVGRDTECLALTLGTLSHRAPRVPHRQQDRGVPMSMAEIIDRRHVAERLRAEIGRQVVRIREAHHVTPQETLLELIDRLNADPAVHGILVQLPLPPQVDAGRAWSPATGSSRAPS